MKHKKETAVTDQAIKPSREFPSLLEIADLVFTPRQLSLLRTAMLMKKYDPPSQGQREPLPAEDDLP